MAQTASITRDEITGVVLAGGRARRMDGADKGLLPLDGKPLVVHVLERLAVEVGPILISANRNLERYAALGHPVVVDELGDYAGPLAGIQACLAQATTRYVVTVPCDTPALPRDLVARLASALLTDRSHAAIASAGGRAHPVVALYDRCEVLAGLATFLRDGGRKAAQWQETLACSVVSFEAEAAAFRNINTPAELASAGS